MSPFFSRSASASKSWFGTRWDPYDFPESLRVSKPGKITVMQLIMGEGKPSVIVPTVATALADGSCLVRVPVSKPQSRQIFQMLVSKLGGLLDRRVYHMPVTRSLKIDEAKAAEIERMCLECMAKGSFFITGTQAGGRCLLRILDFFRASSRDVVDESNENFSARFELIYTMGSQRRLEFSPERWIMAQQLDPMRRYAPAVKEKFPQSIKVEEQGLGSFPRTRLLYENAALERFRMIADHICNNGIGSLPEATRKAVLSYIFNLDLSEQEVAAVEDDSTTSFRTDSTRDPLLLLRGLRAGSVLASCFGQKRWRVNYGPHHTRNPSTSLSVPYRGKDNPAPRPEFSHPDGVVMLTCLSYYCAGLNNDELFSSLRHLIKSGHADIEYQMWVDDSPSLPQAYRQLGWINLQDRLHRLEHVFPNLRMSKAAIDYFLAQVVFPREMKEFPNKLSASGWDIGQVKALPSAEFIGTNHSRILLSVEQLELPGQNHTNALVLEYLL
ncbi:hypothetical protein BDV12DRAFT_195464 [Aspergillus spectabilis]